MIDRLTKLVVLVPVLFAGFGTIIINLGLSSYGLFDHQVFRLHAIYVGATFFIFCLALLVCFAAFTNVGDPSKDSQLRVVLMTVWKVLVVSLALYYLVDRDYTINSFRDCSLCQALIFSNWGSPLLVFPFVFVMVDRFREREVGTKEKVLFWIILVWSTLTYIAQFMVLCNEKYGFREIAFLVGLVGAVFYAGTEGRVSIIRMRKADPDYRPKSLFGPFMSRETSVWDVALTSLFLLLCTAQVVAIYSTNLYPKIPKAYGGMKAQERSITHTDGKVIRGRILHTTTNTLYVVNRDGDIVVLLESEIDRITKRSE